MRLHRSSCRLLLFAVINLLVWYCVVSFALSWWPQTSRAANLSKLTPVSTTDDQVGTAEIELVVAATKSENTTWLQEHLFNWRKIIYVVDDPDAVLTVPQNKGHEAMVILTYIIDRYNTLPPYIIFHHAERFQWHNDHPSQDSVALLQSLRISHLQEQGYTNLRCSWVIGCPVEIRPEQDAMSAPQNGLLHAKYAYSRAFGELFPASDLPAEVGVPCCAQFGVTKETVRARSRDDYMRYREWLLNTDLDDAISGRVFEYTWHMIFNKPSVHCPQSDECYCKQYGLCYGAT